MSKQAYKLASIIIASFHLLVVFGCSPKPNPNELIDVEKAFSDMSGKEGMNKAFLHFADEKAALLRPNRLPIVGNDLKELFSYPDTAFSLTWEPLYAEISKSGDLGYTYGIYTYNSTNNRAPSMQGTYVSIWKKTSKGWKYVLDTGNPGLGK